jgi:hypothetical protein
MTKYPEPGRVGVDEAGNRLTVLATFSRGTPSGAVFCRVEFDNKKQATILRDTINLDAELCVRCRQTVVSDSALLCRSCREAVTMEIDR